MTILKIYAQLSCKNFDVSADWYSKLFNKGNDADPMDGLKEWHHRDGSGFQLVTNPSKAGHGSMTLIVSDLDFERDRMLEAGLNVSEVVVGDFAAFAQILDPDGNTVIIAEPKGT